MQLRGERRERRSQRTKGSRGAEQANRPGAASQDRDSFQKPVPREVELLPLPLSVPGRANLEALLPQPKEARASDGVGSARGLHLQGSGGQPR